MNNIKTKIVKKRGLYFVKYRKPKHTFWDFMFPKWKDVYFDGFKPKYTFWDYFFPFPNWNDVYLGGFGSLEKAKMFERKFIEDFSQEDSKEIPF